MCIGPSILSFPYNVSVRLKLGPLITTANVVPVHKMLVPLDSSEMIASVNSRSLADCSCELAVKLPQVN